MNTDKTGTHFKELIATKPQLKFLLYPCSSVFICG
jgi:hypothetical protein